MVKRAVLLLLVFFQFLGLFQCPVYAMATGIDGQKEQAVTNPEKADGGPEADAFEEIRATLPEGVTEIDLRTVLGEDAQDIADAWMLNADTCVLLRYVPDDGAPGHSYELILLEVQQRTVLSRTLIPPLTLTWYQQGREYDGTFYLKFTSTTEEQKYFDEMTDWRQYNDFTYIKASIAQNGEVTIGDFTDKWYTVMPGGRKAVYTSEDESLYAVDPATGEEELLLQGIPRVQATPVGELYLESLVAPPTYVPFEDELPDYTSEEIWEGAPDDEWDEAWSEVWGNEWYEMWYEFSDASWEETWDDTQDDSLPFIAHDIVLSVREFSVVMPLDEHRFIYAVGSWEWDNGYGIYDLQTHTDHRITGRGDFLGVRGDTLFGTNLKADANTYESSLLPESVRTQFAEIAFTRMDGTVQCDISPNGALVAVTGMNQCYDPASDFAHTVIITDLRTGDIIKTYDIDHPFAVEQTPSFYDDAHVMLFCAPEDKNGSPYIYLFDVEK